MCQVFSLQKDIINNYVYVHKNVLLKGMRVIFEINWQNIIF